MDEDPDSDPDPAIFSHFCLMIEGSGFWTRICNTATVDTVRYIVNIHLLYLGVEVGMAPLLMRRPVAGVLVGLSAVAALVGRPTLVHVGVPYEQCCGSMNFWYGSGCGSIPLTNGSGKVSTKHYFFPSFFAYYFLKVLTFTSSFAYYFLKVLTFTSFLKDKKS
jgi:hypothetical protein